MTAVRPWMLGVGVSVFGLMTAGVGVVLFVVARWWRRKDEPIEDTEMTEIGELRPGPARIRGTAAPAEESDAVRGVMVDGEGLATSLQVQRKSGKSGWRTFFEENRTVPFVVDDGTGEVLVDPPTDAEFDLDVEERVLVNPGGDLPPEVQQFARGESELEADPGSEVLGIGVGGVRRYHEGVLEPGEEAMVVGEVRESDAGWSGPEYVLDGADDSGSFVLSDKSEDQLGTELAMRKGLALLVYAVGAMHVLGGLAIAVAPWLYLLLT